MAGHDDGDSFYADDDLDALPNDTLLELENNAIQFTQAHAQVKAAPSSDYGDEFDDEDLDDAVVIDESRSTPAIYQNFHQPILRPPAFNRAVPSLATQQEQFRQQRYGLNNNSSLANRQRYNPSPKFHDTAHVPALPALPALPAPAPNAPREPKIEEREAPGPDLSNLQRQIEELLKERNALRDDLNAKAGEIAIVRSKQEQTLKEYEREMTALRKLNAEKLAKQQKALEAARIGEKNAVIERDFMKQDLAEESERVRRLNRQKAAEKKDGAASVTTPKKKKPFSHRDGFDDDEIEILSPSKISPSKFQKRIAGSPSKPGKRKRKAVESPAGALEFHVEELQAVQQDPRATVLDEAVIASLQIEDERFDFIGTMLDHRVDKSHLRTLEELGKYALPSSPKESFQSIILGKIPEIGLRKSSKELPTDFCELLISMWKSCLQNKYFKPISLFVDMLTFALELKTSSIAPHIIDSLVPITQLTADEIAIPRYKSTPVGEVEKDIDCGACMALLYLAAQGCTSNVEHITRFWKLFRYDFVLLMLSVNQQPADFEMMLHLLSTSVLRDTFGAMAVDIPQDRIPAYILDRLSHVLYEVPLRPKSQEKWDAAARSKVQLQILLLLTSMTRSPFASKALAVHPLLIGRLVSVISDELDLLYDYQPRHAESARMITLAVRLLYHIVMRYDDIIDVQKKLATIPGGSQKYLLCLSRLNFSEDDLVLESGIDADVARCAVELLEMFVTPQEGEAIQAAFEKPV